jgi:hypothetical protein
MLNKKHGENATGTNTNVEESSRRRKQQRVEDNLAENVAIVRRTGDME